MHILSKQNEPLVHQHFLPLPVNCEQIDVLVPGYDVHGAVLSIQPDPLVRHPLKNVSHKLSLVLLVSSEQTKFLHYVTEFESE